MTKYKIGLAFGIGANILWGMLPIYWKSIREASSLEILANRGCWSLLFCVIFISFRKSWLRVFSILKDPNLLRMLFYSSILLSANWGVFIWAVNSGRVVESALGYYISPIINVLFGIVIFRESLRKMQWIAVVLGSISVLAISYEYQKFPWVAFALAFSWGTYGFIKKKINLGALETLTIETAISFIPNLTILYFLNGQNDNHFGSGTLISFLLFFAGIVTVIPLLLYNGALVRLPLSTIGLMQYLTPTLFFILGVFVFKEEMTTGKFIGFAFIWGALFALGTDMVKSTNSVNN